MPRHLNDLEARQINTYLQRALVVTQGLQGRIEREGYLALAHPKTSTELEQIRELIVSAQDTMEAR